MPAPTPTPPPSPSPTPHIIGEIDLGQFGKIVKREDDEWFKHQPLPASPPTPASSPAPPPTPSPPRKRSKTELLGGTAPLPLADVATQISTPPSNLQELDGVLKLLQQTPEFSSGSYIFRPPDGGLLHGKTYHAGMFPHNDDTGIFYFRGHLLDELDEYFKAIARMRGADPDAYDLYSKVGATINPYTHLVNIGRLPVLWHEREDRPGFGCVSYCGRIKEAPDPRDTNLLRMSYFLKMERPPTNVEPVPDTDDVYQITSYFDEWHRQPKDIPKWLRKHGVCFTYYVAVDPDCRVRALKTLHTRYAKVTKREGQFKLSNKGNPGTRVRKVTDYIPYKEWGHPEHIWDWWRDSGKRYSDSIEVWMQHALFGIAGSTLSPDYAVRINVHNQRGDTAVFSVSPERFAYFFRDRDTVLDHRGRRARIFHWVKPFARHDGALVKGHFRGLRKFKWGPYSVVITVPGLHHKLISEFTPGMVDIEAIEPDERSDLLYSDQIGRALARHIDGDSLTHAIDVEVPGYRKRQRKAKTIEE